MDDTLPSGPKQVNPYNISDATFPSENEKLIFTQFLNALTSETDVRVLFSTNFTQIENILYREEESNYTIRSLIISQLQNLVTKIENLLMESQIPQESWTISEFMELPTVIRKRELIVRICELAKNCIDVFGGLYPALVEDEHHSAKKQIWNALNKLCDHVLAMAALRTR